MVSFPQSNGPLYERSECDLALSATAEANWRQTLSWRQSVYKIPTNTDNAARVPPSDHAVNLVG